MLTASAATAGFGRPSSSRARPATNDGEKKAIWVPMLNSASRGKDLPEKQLLVLGGTPLQQKDFLDQLHPPNARSRFNDRASQRTAPMSNRYTLGYTYQDVLDADQEDTLARVNIYLLSHPSASFAPLLNPLFTPATVKDTLIAILLDWADPLTWARQLRQWIRLLRTVILSLDDETKVAMEENMTAWKEKRLGPDSSTTHNAEQKANPVPPLGPGEWDEGLGMPMAVVCIQSEKIYSLEREEDWNEEHFDFLIQWLRCIALKHGASLLYTSTSDPNSVRTLLHSSLGIHSLLKRETAKPNYLDKDKILIPANWDSWGKIRTLREGTDLEAISDAWSVDIQGQPETIPDFSTSLSTPEPASDESAVSLYESSLPASSAGLNTYDNSHDDDLVTVPSVQEFLQSQHGLLESFKAQDDKEVKKRKGVTSNGTSTPTDEHTKSNPRMAEHIGPYQINVNGIDFDAEEATRRLRERESERERERESRKPNEPRTGTGSGLNTPTKKAGGDDGKASNEAMSAFFANLIKKDKRGGGSGVASGAVSPTRGSPAPERRLE